MKTLTLAITSSIILSLLGGCAALKAKMAQSQLTTIDNMKVGNKLAPTADWHCKQTCATDTIAWSKTEPKFFSMTQDRNMILKQLAAEYGKENCKGTNYINVVPPHVEDISHKSGRFSSTSNLNPDAMATADYYQCEKINPDSKLTSTTTTAVSVGDTTVSDTQ